MPHLAPQAPHVVDIVAEPRSCWRPWLEVPKRPNRLEHRGTGAMLARAELRQPLRLMPWGRPARAA